MARKPNENEMSKAPITRPAHTESTTPPQKTTPITVEFLMGALFGAASTAVYFIARAKGLI